MPPSYENGSPASEAVIKYFGVHSLSLTRCR